MIATDPLSLAFIGCFVVSATFLGISSLLGAGHEDLHLGHIGHLGHGGHAPGASHASGVVHHALPQGHATHTGAHTTASGGHGAPASPPIWVILASFFNLY